MSCNGYPQPAIVTINGTTQTYTKVCLILQEYAAVTSSISASYNVGNMTAHGVQISSTFVVYARVIAQAADEGTATALAKSVTVTTANSTISASPDKVDYPQSLEVDFEIFTSPSTNVALSNNVGNLGADNYNATLKLTPKVGDTSLQNVQGQVGVTTGTGLIDIKLSGTGWSGSGLTASTHTGNVSLSRPANYQAAITAQSDLGVASIDAQSVTTPPAASPATVTAGTGAPIMLSTKLGNASVTVAQ